MFTQREEAKIARIITPFRRMAVLWVKLLKKKSLCVADYCGNYRFCR
jgi:hypothetical protein